jgi:hypothetical protein
MLQAGRSLVRFNLPNLSSHSVVLGFTQPVTEMSTRKIFLGNKARPVRKADNLTTIYELIV